MPAKRARPLELPNELAMQDNQGRGMSAERSVEESGVQRRAKGLCAERVNQRLAATSQMTLAREFWSLAAS